MSHRLTYPVGVCISALFHVQSFKQFRFLPALAKSPMIRPLISDKISTCIVIRWAGQNLSPVKPCLLAIPFEITCRYKPLLAGGPVSTTQTAGFAPLQSKPRTSPWFSRPRAIPQFFLEFPRHHNHERYNQRRLTDSHWDCVPGATKGCWLDRTHFSTVAVTNRWQPCQFALAGMLLCDRSVGYNHV